jgi:hypothetical protein
MHSPGFNPSDAISFDLRRGRVQITGGTGHVLLPTDAVLALLRETPPEIVRDLGWNIGTELGQRVESHFGRQGADLDLASALTVVELLGGELALQGFGSLAVEQWGSVLLFIVDDSPLGPDGAAFIAAVLEAAVQRAFRREVALVGLGYDAEKSRYVAVSPTTAVSVKTLLERDVGWGEVITKLNASVDNGEQLGGGE